MKLQKAVDLAVANVLQEGLTDIFPRPFEVDMLRNKYFANHIRETVMPCLNSGSLAGLKMHATQHVTSVWLGLPAPRLRQAGASPEPESLHLLKGRQGRPHILQRTDRHEDMVTEIAR